MKFGKEAEAKGKKSVNLGYLGLLVYFPFISYDLCNGYFFETLFLSIGRTK